MNCNGSKKLLWTWHVEIKTKLTEVIIIVDMLADTGPIFPFLSKNQVLAEIIRTFSSGNNNPQKISSIWSSGNAQT